MFAQEKRALRIALQKCSFLKLLLLRYKCLCWMWCFPCDNSSVVLLNPENHWLIVHLIITYSLLQIDLLILWIWFFSCILTPGYNTSYCSKVCIYYDFNCICKLSVLMIYFHAIFELACQLDKCLTMTLYQ